MFFNKASPPTEDYLSASQYQLNLSGLVCIQLSEAEGRIFHLVENIKISVKHHPVQSFFFLDFKI